MGQYINFFDGYINDKALWFSNNNFNGLMKMNIESGKTELIDTFPENDIMGDKFHINVIKAGDCLYFIPYKSKYINIWSLNESKWEESIKLQCKDNTVIVRAVNINEEEIWIFPSDLSTPVMIFNIKNKTIDYADEITDDIKEMNKEAKASLGASSVCLNGDDLIISFFKKSYLFVIDYKKRKIKSSYNLENNISIKGIKHFHNYTYWVWCADSSDIYLWNMKNSGLSKLKTEVRLCKGRMPFADIINIGKNKAVVLPCHYDKILLADAEKASVSQLDMPKGFKRCNVFTLFRFYNINNNEIILFPCGGNMLLRINIDDLSVLAVDFKLSDELQTYAEENMLKKFDEKFISRQTTETMGWCEILPMFIEKVCNEDKTEKETNEKEKNIGSEIYNIVKNML